MESNVDVVSINLFILLAGLWLMITAIAFGYHVGTAPQENDFFIGALVATVALICAVYPSTGFWLSWVTVALGLWLVLSPFLLGYSDLEKALLNDIVTGLIVVGLGTWSALEGRKGSLPRR